MLTVAFNLGFICDTASEMLTSGRQDWNSGASKVFYCEIKGVRSILFEVKGFKNANLHIRLNQKFALALNVEYGRLKGWLKSGNEANDELGVDNAHEVWQTQHLILLNSNTMLLLQ